MFANKKSNIAISIIVAIMLWMYVIGQVDPQTTIKISNIPVTYTNENVLSERGLAVADTQSPTVSVTIEGNRADVKKIKEENIIITVDVSEMGKGKNSAKVNVQTPSDVDVVKVDPETVILEVEDKVSQRKKVKVNFEGELDKGLEPGGIEVNPEEITVSGAKSNVDKVKNISAKIDVQNIKEEETILVTRAVPVDEHGNEVKHVELSSQKVDVKVALYETKEVKLNVKTTGSVSSTVELAEIVKPEMITIKGQKNIIENIESVDAEDINISGIKVNTNLPIVPILNQGVEVANASGELFISVKIKEQVSTNVEKTSKDIEVENLGEKLKATINEETLNATIRGKASVISGFTKADLLLFIDLKDLGVGEHTVTVQGTTTKEVGSITIAPKTIKVVIKEEE